MNTQRISGSVGVGYRLAQLGALGVALAGVGVAGLVLLTVWRRSGERLAAIAAAVTVGVVATANAYGVYTVGALLFWGPTLCAVLVVVGVVLALRDR